MAACLLLPGPCLPDTSPQVFSSEGPHREARAQEYETEDAELSTMRADRFLVIRSHLLSGKVTLLL